MEEFETKSAIIGKKGSRDEQESYPIFVNLFDENDPHKNPKTMPKRFLEYTGIHKIMIKGLDVEYLLIGKDIVINNLKKIRISVDEVGHLIIDGNQQ